MLKIEDLKEENFGRHKGSEEGLYLRSNEFPGEQSDVVYHKNKLTLGTYYKIFRDFIPQTILEIGVKEGGSLLLWSELFPEARVMGLEIELSQLSSSSIKYMVGRPVKVIHADCTHTHIVNPLLLRKFPEGIDLIIDDGAHDIKIMSANFYNLFPRLTEKGIYVIEDWRALAWVHRAELLRNISESVEEPGVASCDIFRSMIVVRKNGKNGHTRYLSN